MFDTGIASGGDADEVPLAEASELLVRILPYLYHEPVAPIECDPEQFWPLVKALDKYEVSCCRSARSRSGAKTSHIGLQINRGVEAAVSACR